MYLAIEFMDAGQGIRLITRGRVPGALLVDAHRTFAEEHGRAFAAARYWFSNHCALEAVLLDHAHARSIATLCTRMAVEHPRLVVGNMVPGDLEFGMVRTWQALADQTGWRVGTYRDEPRLQAFFEEHLDKNVDLHGPADGPPVVVYADSTHPVS